MTENFFKSPGMSSTDNHLPDGGQPQAVQGDGEGLAKENDGGIPPPAHVRGARQVAQEIVRRHRQKDGQGKEPGKSVPLLRPPAVLLDGLLREQQGQQRLAAVSGHGEGHEGADADAYVVVDKAPHRAEQNHAHQAP